MITKDMLMNDIVNNYEGATSALSSMGMGCVSCPAALSEPLETAALVHGLNADEVVSFLNEKLGLSN